MSAAGDDALKQPSWRLRLLLVLYSNANIAGCALALLGPALLFAGVIDRGWWAITALLYAAGWLVGRRAPVLERDLSQTLSAEDTLAHLDDLLRRAAPQLTPEMRQRLDGIRASVAEVMPRLVAAQATGGAHSAELFTVRETVLRYLPETLSNYVALPPAFRANHVLAEGKTARQLLVEQLALLDRQLQEVVTNVAASNAQALLANGTFLRQRFQQPDFLAR